MRDLNDLKLMEKEIKKKFVLGGHKAYYLTKALQRVKVVLVSVMPDYYVTNIFKLGPARTMNDALQEAFAFAGKNAKVLAMPFGNNTLPIVKPS
jgi:nickel-dependent lactate racemase